VPASVARWASRARYLRWLDALAGWLVLWGAVAVALPRPALDVQLVLALILLGVLAPIPPVRVRWRPVSAWVGLSVSRDLRPGDRAWWVRPGQADLVLVTARRGTRLVVATRERAATEAISLRRTRGFFVPADERRDAPA
jgi:hypothetical protein